MTTVNCKDCEQDFDTDDEGVYSNIMEAYFCDECYASDIDHASTVTFVSQVPESSKKILVGDAFIINEYGDEYESDNIKRQWIKTDEWRGHHDTTIDGYTAVLTGWTTGGWGDPIADRKQVFNDWAEDLILNGSYAPCSIAVITDPTSNLFSTGISVAVPNGSEETFKVWLEETGYSLSDLAESLS